MPPLPNKPRIFCVTGVFRLPENGCAPVLRIQQAELHADKLVQHGLLDFQPFGDGRGETDNDAVGFVVVRHAADADARGGREKQLLHLNRFKIGGDFRFKRLAARF